MARRVMILEDETDIRIYLMAALEDNGYETCTVEPHEPVLTAVKDKRPDLVVLDVMMPERSGISIYKELRSTQGFENIPVVMLSGVTPEIDFVAAGFRDLLPDRSIAPPDGFIEKPVDLKKFFELVAKLIARQEEISL